MELAADKSLSDVEGGDLISKEVTRQFNGIWLAMRTRCVCLMLAIPVAIAGLAGSAVGQTNQGSVIAPAREGLETVHLPAMESFEPSVREHLAWAQNTLAAVKASSTSAEKLAEVYGVTGEIYHAYSLYSAARECYLNASRLAPKDFRWLYLLGKLNEREGRTEEAINYYNSARELRIDYVPIFVSLGNIYLQLNRVKDAEANFTRALNVNENTGAAQYGLGQAALSKRSYADAVTYLEKALALAPESNRLHYALAMAYRGLGKMDQAQAHLLLSGTVGVRVSDPLVDDLQNLVKGARLHLILGRTALEARRFSEAITQFRKAVAAQPDSVPAHFNLGVALGQTGDLPAAIAEFEETLRLDPTHANAHYNLGLMLSQANQHEDAIKHLQSSVNIEPNDFNARFLLGQQLLIAGRFDDAEIELGRVVNSDPDNEDALLEWANTLLKKKQNDRALEALEKGHKQFPQKGRTTVTLAYLLVTFPQFGKRDGKRALQLAQAAYQATGSINQGVLVAMALGELGRCDEAAEWVRRLTAKAAWDNQTDLLMKLRAELTKYEHRRPCRAPAEMFSIQSLSP